MNNTMILYLMGGTAGAFVVIILVYFSLRKKMQKSDYMKIRALQQGTKSSNFSTEIMYQKLYLTYVKIPFIKRYIYKLRRRLEIIDADDEYATRRDSAKILTKALAVLIPLILATILLTKNSYLIMSILLIFELFMIDTIIDGSVDKMDNNILREQLDFFSEIRHNYHEYNMVEEAIYQTSQDDEKSISRQGERIHEILIADDPEMELEKYYDVAPNAFLKEFAGVSYLTKEFGDRKVDGASLYLKNINNIGQEMQLEILKRDKLNYVFQSLAVISIVPILGLEPLKSWSISNFDFTESWYVGKPGMIVQILILIITFVSYILVRKLKDNGSTGPSSNTQEHPWQEKLYKKPIVKQIVNLFVPKEGTKEHRKITNMLKDAASPLKIEWLFVNRIALAIVTAIVSIILFGYLHTIAVDWIYTEPTTDYDVIGGLSEKDEKKAMEVTEEDNKILDKFKGNLNAKRNDIKKEVKKSKFYSAQANYDEEKVVDRLEGKIKAINSEYIQWFEILLSLVFALIAYMGPMGLLLFQVKMRQLEMEDEVMQFQTIILMLMRIERVNVEIILEWLERYSNIFRAPISKCVNNYEAGAWEALEQMKEDVSFLQFIRIIESLQAAVEKIPIRDAFDELESERDYYQEKRKESNERLIKRKAMIGKAIGFAPMVVLFVGYLIVPLVFIGLTSMTSSMSSMMSMQ